MCDWLSGVSIETLLTVVTVAPRGVVSALYTDAARGPPAQQVQLLVKPALLSVHVTVTGCKQTNKQTSKQTYLYRPSYALSA